MSGATAGLAVNRPAETERYGRAMRVALAPQELSTMTVTEAVAAFKAGTLSPVALMEASLARIDAVNPVLNAFTEIHSERALDQARAAEDAYRRGSARPLEGIPVAIKDFHPVAGELTTFGSKAFADNRPTHTAPTVARLARRRRDHARTHDHAGVRLRADHGEPAVGRHPQPLEPGPRPRRLVGRRRRSARSGYDDARRRHRCGRLGAHSGGSLPRRRLQAAVRAQSPGPRPSDRIAAPLWADGAERRRTPRSCRT